MAVEIMATKLEAQVRKPEASTTTTQSEGLKREIYHLGVTVITDGRWAINDEGKRSIIAERGAVAVFDREDTLDLLPEHASEARELEPDEPITAEELVRKHSGMGLFSEFLGSSRPDTTRVLLGNHLLATTLRQFEAAANNHCLEKQEQARASYVRKAIIIALKQCDPESQEALRGLLFQFLTMPPRSCF